MWSIFITVILLSVLTSVAAEVQDSYANDPCGDPRSESSFWISVSGHPLVVIDGDTFTMSHEGKGRTVQLVGIEAPDLDQPYGRDAQALLERLIKVNFLDVWINPSDAHGKNSQEKDILGVVYLRGQNMLDVNLELIKAGLARHKPPPPYKMSNYTVCRYYKAEEQAQAAKVGLWSGAE